MWAAGDEVQITTLNESPVFLLLDPAPHPSQKELPVHLYESGTLAYVALWSLRSPDEGLGQRISDGIVLMFRLIYKTFAYQRSSVPKAL